MLVGLAPLCLLAASRIAFPYDLGHYEASNWAPAELLAHGRNPYATWRTLEPPYVMAPYGPAFYALVGIGLRAFGPELWFGRLLGSAALAVSMAAIWLLVRRFRDPLSAWLAVLIFGAGLPAQAWLGVQRPDVLALACGLAAVLAATRSSGGVGEAALAGVLAASALLLRQTTIVPALVAGAWTMRRSTRVGAVAFGAAFGLAFAVPTALLEATAPHGYLWQQYVLPASVPLSAQQLATLATAFARHAGSWVVVAAAVALLARGGAYRAAAATSPQARGFARAALAALLASASAAAITSARLGSNVNYWLEPTAWLALALGMLAPGDDRRFDRRTLAAAALVGALAIDVTAALGRERTRWSERPYLDELVTTLASLGSAGECAIAIYPELATAAGLVPYFNDGIQYDGRSPAQYAAFRRTLAEGRCAALVLPFPEPLHGYARVPLPTPPSTMLPAYLFRRAPVG